MLQTRLENEQFGLLPVLYTNSRSRHDFLNSDRPDSAQVITHKFFSNEIVFFFVEK